MSTANSVTSGLDCSSPESIMDPTNLTPTGDQYSLGCVIYYMLAGQYPFPDGSAAEKMMAHQFKQPDSLAKLAPETPPELVAVVERLMQKKPEARYRTVGEVVEALRPFAPRASAVHARPSSKATVTTKRAAAKADGKATVEAPKSVAPSTPTPRPQTVGSLPTRDTLRGTAAPSKPIPKPEKPKPIQETFDDGTVPGGDMDVPKSFWEGSLGPVGVFLTALLACGIGYLALRFFN